MLTERWQYTEQNWYSGCSSSSYTIYRRMSSSPDAMWSVKADCSTSVKWWLETERKQCTRTSVRPLKMSIQVSDATKTHSYNLRVSLITQDDPLSNTIPQCSGIDSSGNFWVRARINVCIRVRVSVIMAHKQHNTAMLESLF